MAEKRNYEKKNKSPVSASEFGKLPPQAIELETSVLSCLMNDNAAMDIVGKILKPECFYKVAHQKIFKAICDLANNDKPFDMLSIVQQLRVNVTIDDIGGPYQIALIANEEKRYIDSIEFHSYVILETFIKREMIQLFNDNIIKLYEDKTDVKDIYDTVYERMEEIFTAFDEEMIHHINSTIDRALKEIELYSEGNEIAYIKCGDRLFDEVIYTSPGDIISIASARSAGKTRYLIKLIRGFCQMNKPSEVAFLWYSMEDPDTKIVRAFASSSTGLSDAQMQSKGYKLSNEELSAIKKEMDNFCKWDIEFVCEQDSISQISRRFTRFMKKRPEKICFLLIDNIMLIEDIYTCSDSFKTGIEDKVAGTISHIKNKATKAGYKVVVIFLHHMTKEMESKGNAEEAYRPKLSHMKGSTRFADVATSIVLLNNPGMHKDLIKKNSILPDILCANSDGSNKYVKRESLLQNMVIAEVAKNRNGEVADDNIVVCRYVVDFKVMKFVELNCIK